MPIYGDSAGKAQNVAGNFTSKQRRSHTCHSDWEEVRKVLLPESGLSTKRNCPVRYFVGWRQATLSPTSVQRMESRTCGVNPSRAVLQARSEISLRVLSGTMHALATGSTSPWQRVTSQTTLFFSPICANWRSKMRTRQPHSIVSESPSYGRVSTCQRIYRTELEPACSC